MPGRTVRHGRPRRRDRSGDDLRHHRDSRGGSAQQGVGSALDDFSCEVSGASGIAVIGSILTAASSTHANVSGLSNQIATQVKSSYAIASQLAGPIPDRANTAFLSAMQTSLLTEPGLAPVAAVRVVALLAGRTQQVSAPELEDTPVVAAADPVPGSAETG
jgi:hypothetical protein